MLLLSYQEIQVDQKNTRTSGFFILILIKTKNYSNKNNINIKY